MSTYNISTSFSDFQDELNQRIEEKKRGKIEISNSDYTKLQVLRFVIVAGNGAFNALYGWSLGYNILSCILLASVMFSGDWALSLLHQITSSTKQAYAYSGGVTKAGLIFLSLVAGTSFMLGIKHSQEVKNSNIPLIQENIARLNKVYEETHNTKARVAREEEQEKLRVEKERVGDFSPANAFPAYLAKSTGWDYEVVAMALNVLWIAVLLFTGMSLSAQLGMVWCPSKANAIGKEITGALKAQAKLEKAHFKALKSRQKVVSEMQGMIEESYGLGEQETSLGKSQKAQSTRPRKQRAPTRDTGTQGKLGSRYDEVVEAVQTGELKPSLAKIRSFAKCGSNTAHGYLKQLASDGLIYREGQGFKAQMQ